jgi:hypothetical protein
MDVAAFCDMHNACDSGVQWGLVYASMQELWDKGDNVEYIVWVASRYGVLTNSEMQAFKNYCASLAMPLARPETVAAYHKGVGTVEAAFKGSWPDRVLMDICLGCMCDMVCDLEKALGHYPVELLTWLRSNTMPVL